MTANQIAYWQLQEDKRHHLATETETNRSNLAIEAETNRANVAREYETTRHNTMNETIGLGTWWEQERHNKATESETNRSNLAKEAETHRHNRYQEHTNWTSMIIDNENTRLKREQDQRQFGFNYGLKVGDLVVSTITELLT